MENIPRIISKPVYVTNEYGEMNLIKGKKAIVNEANQEIIYCVSSDRYFPPQYEDTLNEMEKAINSNPEFGEPERNVRLIDGGAKMKVNYDFPKLSIDIDPKVGDLVNLRLTLLTAYDCSTMFSVLLEGLRLVCLNGMVGSIKMADVRRIHSKSLHEDISKGFLDDTIHKFSMQTGIWKRWVDEVVEYEDTKNIMETMDMGQRDSATLKEELDKNFDANSLMTKWMLFNMVTAFITHKVESEKKKLRMEERARRAFYTVG